MPLIPVEQETDRKKCLVSVHFSDTGTREVMNCFGMIVRGDVFKRPSDGMVCVLKEFDSAPEGSEFVLAATADKWEQPKTEPNVFGNLNRGSLAEALDTDGPG